MKWNRSVATIAAALTLAFSTPAKAQRITLVHGFNSSGGTWNSPFNTQDYLFRTFGIPVDAPTYPWYLPVNLGAAMINVTDPANTILVGHSEGGVISRRFIENHQVAGLITLGTPHNGANMATNYPMFLAQVGHIFWDIRAIFSNLWSIDPPWWLDLPNRISNAMYNVYDWLGWLLNRLISLVAYVPAVGDLQPNSAFYQGLNGGPGFVAEINNAPRRVSLTYQDPMYWEAPMWRLAAGDQLGYDLGVVMNTLGYGALDVWAEAQSESDMYGFTYDDSRWFALQDLIYASSWLYVDAQTLDFQWCADVSMRYEAYWNAPQMVCAPNDLFIATSDQGAPASRIAPAEYAKHTDEPSRADDIYRSLVADFGLHRE
jgi:pimeloyl-ACP methyl ester carboxylesterase